ncbi:MAG: NTP transferase domain-containing protein [Candidatus Rokubacteria bacterium]|nr:NTP transferase domain-containing protein [Candidatus Rokubacteria bacterium]
MGQLGTSTWALILAGGDGTRLKSLTTQIAGDARPKQFCRIVDGETLLDVTRRRVDLMTRFDQQVVVVSRPHEAYYRYLTTELAPGRLVVQPANRGTAPGILYPLLRVNELAGDVPIAVFPSDHDLSDAQAFMAYVQSAVEVVRERPNVVVLLGIQADRPETEYGWIEPSTTPLPIDGEPAFPICRFWEKPSQRLAEALLSRDCLWNSFVMVGWTSAFLGMFRTALPGLLAAFEPLRSLLGTPAETEDAERLYRVIPDVNFSDRVLSVAVERLVALRVKGVEWSDWGNVDRVMKSLARARRRPAWLERVELASTA